MNKTDLKFRTALEFLLAREGRRAQSRLSKEQSIDSGYLNSIIKGRKPGSITVREKIAAHFDLEYEDMLYLGRWILSGRDGNEWQVGASRVETESVSNKTNPFPPKKWYEDRNLQLLAEWIGLQSEPSDFWTLIKMYLSRQYPEFDAWLKQRKGENNQARLPEKTAA